MRILSTDKVGNMLYPFIVCAERPLPLRSTLLSSGALLHRTSSSGVHHWALEAEREKERGIISKSADVLGPFPNTWMTEKFRSFN